MLLCEMSACMMHEGRYSTRVSWRLISPEQAFRLFSPGHMCTSQPSGSQSLLIKSLTEKKGSPLREGSYITEYL